MFQSESALAAISMGKTIVVCMDKSKESDEALEFACDCLYQEGDLLELLHVQTPEEHVDEIHDLELVGPLYEVGKVSEESIALVDRWLKKCRALHIDNVREEVIALTQGGVGQSLCAYMATLESPRKIMVLGPRKKGRIEALLYGSVSSHCLNHSPCPVVFTKSQ